jgi:multidrug transporter EmrE-like cation transporter
VKTYLVLAISILSQATGNVFLSKGMKQIGSASGIGEVGLLVPFAHAIGSPTIWLGAALLLIAFLLFSAALSWADLSFVLPTVSVEVIVNVAFADYFLNEPVSAVRWIGTVFVSTGVILVMRSQRQKVQEK